MIEQQAPVRRNVVVRVRELSADEEARLLEEKRELARLDRDTIINRAVRAAKQEGKQEARQIGKQEGKREIAKQMKAKRYQVQEIIDLTGLPAAEIETL